MQLLQLEMRTLKIYLANVVQFKYLMPSWDAQLVEHRSVHQKAMGSVPSQDMHLDQ